MDFRDDAANAAFRTRLREWLAVRRAGRDYGDSHRELLAADRRFMQGLQWHRELYKGGWLGLDWPVEYGGKGLGPEYPLILHEELGAVYAPVGPTWIGLELVGPTLLRWGSEDQKNTYLPGILDGSVTWCQGFSEPEAGSDLASVTTLATRSESGWVLEGQKRWTSWAHLADRCLVVARTGSREARHRALTCFIMPTDDPRVTIEPIPMMHGDAEECDVFLHGVQVPDDAVVGELDGGWHIVMNSLDLARGPATFGRITVLNGMFRQLADEILTSRGAASAMTTYVAELYAEVEALRYLAYRMVGETSEAGKPGRAASVEKLLWARLYLRVTRLALDWSGLSATPRWNSEFYRAIAAGIEGGTDEIQRTIIARHVLGLPS